MSDTIVYQVPEKRLGKPKQVGQTCDFLFSKSASYITGQNISNDGGLYKNVL
ncbi:MAG: hypothetical protein CMK30_03370 [Porticoccaceae bacterium]|nr:hypothetical protein [Porticoccaceae bacterium]